MTKKEFVETMYAWYKDYKKDRWVNVNYNKIAKLDNKKYFKDVDLNSEFWKKLLYFVWKKWFKENEYFLNYMKLLNYLLNLNLQKFL